MTKLCVTGGSGFVGEYLSKVEVFKSALFAGRNCPKFAKRFVHLDLDQDFDLTQDLQGIETVVHLAGVAHDLKKATPESKKKYERVNTQATYKLVQQALLSGVQRFIFMSTIKVLGDKSSLDNPFTDTSQINPVGAYAKSKADAEKAIIELCSDTEMDFVILRPPLVYGSSPKGNLRRLEWLASLPFPLPLSGLDNRRSLLSLQNLLDVLILCLDHPNAANEILLLCDQNSVSTSQILGAFRRTQLSNTKDFHLPEALLRLLFYSCGLKTEFDKLTETLVIDSSRTEKLLSWSPRPFQIS